MDKKEEHVLECAGCVWLFGRDTNIIVPASFLVRVQFRVPQTYLKLIQETDKGFGFRGQPRRVRASLLQKGLGASKVQVRVLVASK